MLVTDVAQLNSIRAKSGAGGVGGVGGLGGVKTQERTVIIGSGAIGLYAASLLAKRAETDGGDVVVIEAGGVHLGSFDADSFTSIGNRNDGIRIGRSRSLGGTTNLWGGQLVEFQPIDFAGRDWLPGSKWPVTYEDVAPHYRATYENLGIDLERQEDEAVWRSVSAKRPDLGADFEPFLTRWLKIPSFSIFYEKQIASDERLVVLTGHTAIGFVASPAPNGRVTAVRVTDAAGKEHQIEGDTFILAAGTIEISRLLLHAAADPSRPCPWRQNKNIGAYFQDHLGGRVAIVAPNSTRAFFNTFCTIARGGHKYQPKIRLRNSVLERDRILNIQGLFAFESSASEHLVYLKQFLKAALYSRKFSGIGDLMKNAAGSVKYLGPLMWRYIWDHRIFVPSTAKIALLIQGEQYPTAESRVRIDPTSVDKHTLPKVILDWRLGGDELASIREFAVRADAAMQAAGLAKLSIEEDLLAMNPRFMSTLRDTLHQSGGAVMGRSAEDGVVDKDLRVFGTTNLYIGGSSTFRTIGNANTTFTALAFVTRLVEHLSQKQTPAA